MKEGDIIYTLTQVDAEMALQPRGNQTEQAQAIIRVLEDIAFRSNNQEDLTNSLTLLRNTAIKANKKSLFDRCYDMAKNGGINPEDMNGLEWRFHYNADDFGNGEEPFKEIFFQPTAFLKQRTLDRITVEASKAGFRGFKATYKAYENSMRLGNQSNTTITNPSDFPDQPLELECGEWHCDNTGVSKVMRDKVEYACLHPIMPVRRLVNIDTNEEKLTIAFYKGKYWKEFTASKRDLFDSNKIIQFSALGISVTSKSAKLLAEYLCDVETLNENIIKETESVARLGYIGDNKEQFSPYFENIVFDGDANYGNIYASIGESGDYPAWLAEAQKCRSESLTAQIMLAASFASPLIGKIGCLPFFVHLWGVESGTGKTVALMLAASVWGNPAVGQYIQTFNATQVGHEKTAAFLNNIPMCIDELQLSKDSHGKSRFDVYQLSQGVGRTRGNKSGGIDRTPTWSLCVLTTGESPLTSDSSGAGAVNRVIDIECKASDSVIKDGFVTSSCIKLNYGGAGKRFIEALTPELFEKAKERYQVLFKELSSGKTTEKQAMAAALVILADELADDIIFKSGKKLTIADMSAFLKDKADVSAGQRAYDYLFDWISVNKSKFSSDSNEFWGYIDENKNRIYIVSSVFRSALTDKNFDERAVLSWLKSNQLIEPGKDGKNTIKTTIAKHSARYVVLKMQEVEPQIDDVDEEYIELLN